MKKLLITITVLVLSACQTEGKWMSSEAFYYQGIRTIGHAQYQGASVTESLHVLNSVKFEDPEDWYKRWMEMAQYQEKLDDGFSLLRSSNYYRISEFFLPTSDERRLTAYIKSRGTFVRALSKLNIEHRILDIPYNGTTMRAYYFPGDIDKPLIMFSNGLDGTVEESYFFNGVSAINRGFPVLLYEGPGQSMLIRKDNIKFTNEWEKPVEEIISYITSEFETLKGRKTVLYGISMGGLISGMAANNSEKIHGVIIHGSPMDLKETFLEGLPGFARKLYSDGKFNQLDNLVNFLDKSTILSFQKRWAFNQAKWVFGKDSISQLLDLYSNYNLNNFKRDIPILVMNGEDDLYIGVNNEENNLKNATIINFTTQSGASSHCQGGAIEQTAPIVFKWLEENFTN